MSTIESSSINLLAIVKSREVQCAMAAEARKNPKEAAKHFLAAAHLELVLADEYADAGNHRMAYRSRYSAASCFWQAGHAEQARPLFSALIRDYPDKADDVNDGIAELEQALPTTTSTSA